MPSSTAGFSSALLPTRLSASAREQIEISVQTIGRSLLEKSLAGQPSPISSEWWVQQAGEWAMHDDELKVRLFRLVDCMPMLEDPTSLNRHMREYLDKDTLRRLPTILRMAMAFSECRLRSLGRRSAGNESPPLRQRCCPHRAGSQRR